MRSSIRRNRQLGIERLEARDVPALYTVTTMADAGAGSLRQAIIDANGHAGADQIRFNLGPNVANIHLLSALPNVTDTLDIDGAIDANHHGHIVLDGSGAGASANGLWLLNHSGSRVANMVINGFSGSGIYIQGGGSHTLVGNYLGTDVTGGIAVGNLLDGITIDGSSKNNIGGGSDTIAILDRGNLISGNGRDGVRITGAASENLVIGDFIGVSADLSKSLGNKHDGVAVQDGASKTSVGAPYYPLGGFVNVPIDRASSDQFGGGNIISGNGRHGVFISGTVATSDNTFYYGVIGAIPAHYLTKGGGQYTNVDILAAPNGGDGIFLGPNVLRTDIQSVRILGNLGNGITVSGASNTTIAAQEIGADKFGNKGDGIRIEAGSTHTTIRATPQFFPGGVGVPLSPISYNGGAGVRILGGNDTRITNITFTQNGDLPIARGPAAAFAPIPVITGVQSTPTRNFVNGTIHGLAIRTYEIEVYIESTDASGTTRHFRVAGTTTTNLSGDGVFHIQVLDAFAEVFFGSPNSDPNARYVATATDMTSGETSQMSSLSPPAVRQGGIVTGHVFVDVNRNGVKDGKERGADNFITYVDGNHNGVLDSATEPTTYIYSDGSYSLPVEDNGSADIRIKAVDGRIDARVIPNHDHLTVNVSGGATLNNIDFALAPTVGGAIGQGAGGKGLVLATDTAGNILGSFQPFANFTGAIDVATGDVNGDGQLDVIVAAGQGGGPHAKIFDGNSLFTLKGGGAANVLKPTLIREFFAYSDKFFGGVSVAAGDVNGDQKADIITGAGPGGGPHVKVFDGATGRELASYFAYDPAFRGGVDVAVADAYHPMFYSNSAEIITGAGPGGGPHVRVFDALSGFQRASFYAFDPSFRGGVNVAVGNLESGAYAGSVLVRDVGPILGSGYYSQLITGMASMGSTVNAYNLQSQDAYRPVQSITLERSLTAFPGFNGGVRVAYADIYHHFEGHNQLILGAGPGGGAHIRYIDGPTGNEDHYQFVFDPGFTGGVFVG